MLKVNEIFYSIQGEGYWVGTPMIFIRLSGCNLNCPFCDTEHGTFTEMSEGEILEYIKDYSSKKVCITGGEPLIQNIYPLVYLLQSRNYQIHLETNGTLPLPLPYYWFNWITVSPKNLKCNLDTIRSASEIKFLCGCKDWERFILTYELPHIHKYLQPIHNEEGPLPEALDLTLKYIKKSPTFKLSVQLHKLIGVK